MRILSVTKKDLLLILKDRGQLISLFLLPLVFILSIGYAFPRDGYNLDADRKPRLPVANFDAPALALGTARSEDRAEASNNDPGRGMAESAAHTQELIDFLSEGFEIQTEFAQEMVAQLGLAAAPECAEVGPACDERVAEEMVRRSWRDVAVVIPAGFSAGIDAGEHVTLTLLYEPGADAIRRQVLEAVIRGGAMQLSIQNQVFRGFEQFENLLALAPDEVRESVGAERDAAMQTEQQPALSVVTVQPSSFTLAERPDTYQQTVPGYTVMFVFFLIAYLSGAIQAEKNGGTLRRLLYMPVSRSTVLGGKLLAAFVIGLAQVAILFAVGYFLFGMGLGQAPLALVLLTMALVLAAVGIGLAAAAFGAENVLTVPLIVAALLGGCLFPAAWLPTVLRTLGYVVPHGWAMTGYQDILVRGQGLMQVLPSIAVLLGFALLFFVIAVRRLEFD